MKTLAGCLFLCLWLQLDCEWKTLGNKSFASVHCQSMEQTGHLHFARYNCRKENSVWRMVARLTSCCFLLHMCEQRRAGGALPSSLQCPGGRQCHYHLHLPSLLLLGQAIAWGGAPVPYGRFGFLKWVWKRRKSTHCPTEYERQISLSEHHSSSSWTLSHVLLCSKCTVSFRHVLLVHWPENGLETNVFSPVETKSFLYFMLTIRMF